MNLRKASALSVCVCLVLSMLALVEPVMAQTVDQAPVKYGLEAYADPLNLTSRAMIYNYVVSHPGAHLRQICSQLDIAMGSAQYHLERLVDGELLESEKESRYRRFFASRRFSEFEKRVISLLNRDTTRKIVELLLVRVKATQSWRPDWGFHLKRLHGRCSD